MSLAPDRRATLELRDRPVADRTTRELLAVLLGDEAASAAVAARIDAGDTTFITATPEELATIAGVMPSHGRTLSAAFEVARRAAAAVPPPALRTSADVAATAQRELGGCRRERLLTIVCDSANRPLRTVVVADGALDRCCFPVREILNAVLRFDGRAFALAHNHPGGPAQASDADGAATSTIADAARIVGVRFLGHVVVGGGGWAPVTPRALGTLG